MSNPADRELISQIRRSNLTYLSVPKLASIAQVVRHIERGGLPGIFIEAGCALGGSTILIAKTKNRARPLRVYDVFGMIPPPTPQDGRDVISRYETIRRGEAVGIGGQKYYGYEDKLYERVLSNLSAFGITPDTSNILLVKGLVQETMQVNEPVAFASIDVDWYDPVKTCLERIVPHLCLGGTIILDDYKDWSGCRQATDEYFSDKHPKFSMDDSAGSLKITRVAL